LNETKTAKRGASHIYGSVRRLFVVISLVSMLSGLQTATGRELFEFNIPAQSLDDALQQLASQSDSISLFRYDLVENKSSSLIQGRYTLDEALSILLQDTGLSWGLSDKRVIRIIHEQSRINNEDETLKTKLNKRTSLLAAFIAFFSGGGSAIAQDTVDQSEVTLDEILVIGSRRSDDPRSSSDTPVPVDILKADDLANIGGAVDLTDSLKSLVPSYTATPLTGDGSAFVRTTSLRGLSPDQTLLLVNGKRRHRSSLVQFAAPSLGQGAHAADVGMIPSIALKNVQVLRDGAAAQYGSDAIAGVINFSLKDASEGGSVRVQLGEHYEGEGNYQIAANAGFSLGEDGFMNFSIENIDNDAISRGIQTTSGQALVDAGIPGVGADSPFGDTPLTQTWGRPESSGTRFVFNAGLPLNDNMEIYTFGNYASTEARTRFFFRRPITHSSILALVGNNPSLGSNPFPVGYTPFFDGEQTDFSLVGGLRGTFANGMNYDFSIGYGENELEFTLFNTINPGQRVTSVGQLQRDFDLGTQFQEEINLNADFSKELNDSLHLAFGFEWREETFGRTSGEPASFTNDFFDPANPTAQPQFSFTSGFSSPTPLSAREDSRDNFAVYVDVEHDISDRWLMQYALRAEDFSDFGSTLNGKLASRFNVSDSLSLRGAVSTGFHAPTPGQSNVSAILTTIDTTGGSGELIEVGLVPADSPEAAEVGGAPLTEEESLSLSLGAVISLGENTDLTIDWYKVEVDDRIYQVPNAPIPGRSGTRSFFTNALDVESTGVDVVLSTKFREADIAFAYAYNDIDVTRVGTVTTSAGVSVAPISDGNVENIEVNLPEHRFVISGNIPLTSRLNLMLRGNYYGDHFDERGRIGGDRATDSDKFEISSIFLVDAELTFSINENLSLTLGANNLFDEQPDEIRSGLGFANRESVGLQFPRRTPVDYNGGSYYLRATYDF